MSEPPEREGAAVAATPFIATQLRHSLGSAGPLPRDLLAAYNGAIHAATLAGNIVARLRCRPYRPIPLETDAELFKVTLQGLYANAELSRQAVKRVSSRLNATREARGPARFGQIVSANAHTAALDYAAQVRLRIRVALLAHGGGDDADAVTLLTNPAATLDPDIVAKHLGELWQMIDLTGLPDASEITAEVTIEADMAAQKLQSAREPALQADWTVRTDLPGTASPVPTTAVATPLDSEETGDRKATRPKRSTQKGEGQAKLIAALTKHHQYADGGCLNAEPVGNNELAILADVAPSTASAFFNDKFQGYTKYRAICRDAGVLAASIKMLNGEFSPHDLYGRRPTGEDDRGDEDDE
jgi:hypothetical protein